MGQWKPNQANVKISVQESKKNIRKVFFFLTARSIMHSSGFCADICFSAMKYNKDGKKNCENIYTNKTVCDGEVGGV